MWAECAGRGRSPAKTQRRAAGGAFRGPDGAAVFGGPEKPMCNRLAISSPWLTGVTKWHSSAGMDLRPTLTCNSQMILSLSCRRYASSISGRGRHGRVRNFQISPLIVKFWGKNHPEKARQWNFRVGRFLCVTSRMRVRNPPAWKHPPSVVVFASLNVWPSVCAKLNLRRRVS